MPSSLAMAWMKAAEAASAGCSFGVTAARISVFGGTPRSASSRLPAVVLLAR